jgi:hypothetical protein
LNPAQAQEEEKSYSISLTKTAETQEGKDIHEVDDKKVLAQEYTVQDGDHVWQLLRERGLLQKQNLAELLSVLKKMNKSLDNLDLIHPGEKIIIPLKIAPVAGFPTEEKTVQLADLKDINFQNYTVKQDDHLFKIVRGMYRIPEDNLYSDYLNLVRQMNPSINDLDTIHPGQTIRLPIYSPEVVRVPIETATAKQPAHKEKGVSLKPNPVAHDLAEIFVEIGEEWIQSGEHFIPLKTGGQINLKASSFPIINLRKGHRVIVDLDDKLPSKMARLIESSWNNYRVVHLTKNDSLRSSLDKTIKACNFPKVYKSSESLELGNDIHLKITGDWIIKLAKTDSDNEPNLVVINLRNTNAFVTPGTIKDYLAGFGVKIVDHPPGDDVFSTGTDKVETLKAGEDPLSLIKTVLNLAGKSFSENAVIPVYQTQKDDLKLIIKADYSLKIKGRDAVIDLTGLAPEVISLLEERDYLTLSLATEKDPVNMVARTCEFLGIQFQRGPHHFKAIAGDDSKNIRLTLPGVIFSDPNGESILATPLGLPEEINAFLTHKGYKILFVSFS